ncbi:hypothetical protein ACSE35_01475, partial [Staphylococcus aureus]
YSRYYPANGACRYLNLVYGRYKKLTVVLIVLIVMIQQIVILDNNKNMAIKPYQQSISTLKQHDYSRYYPANGACRYLNLVYGRYKKLTVVLIVLIV